MSNTGWICPRCQKVHAPDVKGCDCKPVGQIRAPLPSFPAEKSPTTWPRHPFDGLLPETPMPLMLHPMPLCGCTGPCANAACPHTPKVMCTAVSPFAVAQ